MEVPISWRKWHSSPPRTQRATRWSSNRSASLPFVRDLEDIGANLITRSGRDSIIYIADILRGNVEKCVNMFADTILHPRLLDEEIQECNNILDYENEDHMMKRDYSLLSMDVPISSSLLPSTSTRQCTAQTPHSVTHCACTTPHSTTPSSAASGRSTSRQATSASSASACSTSASWTLFRVLSPSLRLLRLLQLLPLR